MPASKSRSSAAANPPSRTLIIDNGAYTLKAGFSSPTATGECRVIPNCMARDREKHVYVGSQLERCKDFGDIVFRRPVEKGYLVNWEAEKEIWEHEFFEDKAPSHCDPSETGLILTEAPNALPVLQSNCDQIVFEEFRFARYYRCPAPVLNTYNDIQATFKGPARDAEKPVLPAEIMLLIDSGYSHTTITPLFYGRPLQAAVRRLEVGGKLMTNYLTRLLSLRQYDMRNDMYLVNEIKEACCYVSRDFKGDMEKTWKGTKGDRREEYVTGGGIAKDYVLPDYHNRTKGIVRDHDPNLAKLKKLRPTNPGEMAEDILTLRNERFTVPELIFTPTDIGLQQSGIAELVMQSLSVVPIGLWPALLANIIVVGGNANISDFIYRLQKEIRTLAPAECIVRVARPADPITSTWQGGAALATNTEVLSRLSVTKQEYDEHGSAWVARKFK
ncbi:actin-like protein arp-6 [Phlyctema vagabunda]|uniref:Actin-like protein arp-6 n=1 Tax=Phlyctema vagabunda TaxID=108571 RepID=A0ABR4PL55_9HELO